MLIKKTIRSDDGFSLVEMIITLFLLTLLTITIARVINTSYFILNSKSAEYTRRIDIIKMVNRVKADISKKPFSINTRNNEMDIVLEDDIIVYSLSSGKDLIRTVDSKEQVIIKNIKNISFNNYDSIYSKNIIFEMIFEVAMTETKNITERRNFLVKLH